jgi:predicted RNA methylase
MMGFIHANDAAMGNLGYERAELDFYPTPPEVTEALIPFLKLHHSDAACVWEPGCGTGAMSEVLCEHFPNVLSTDIKDYGYDKMRPGITDFLQQTRHFGGSIVTNPPFGKMAEQFIRKALELTKPDRGVVAMLLRKEYDSASTRRALFRDHPAFAREVGLLWRPRWIAGSTGAPRHNYSWFIWDWNWGREPVKSYALRGK